MGLLISIEIRSQSICVVLPGFWAKLTINLSFEEPIKLERHFNIVRLLTANIYFDFKLSKKTGDFLNKTPIIYDLFGSFPSLATALEFTKAFTMIYS